MFVTFISGNLIKLYKERDEHDEVFIQRIKYINHIIETEKKINILSLDDRKKYIDEIIKQSLCLKNKILYKVEY
jgi:hypothetical protein